MPVIGKTPKYNLTSTTDPTVNDDESIGYFVGSCWVNTISKKIHYCSDSTAGAAVWTCQAVPEGEVARGDAGLSIQGSNWFIDDDGLQHIDVSRSGFLLEIMNSLAAGGGGGLKLMAGDALGDVNLHLNDYNDSFGGTGGAIMEVEANQGFFTFYKGYAQTLIDRGVVYGFDQQNPNANNGDFNTQFGNYRMGGARINGTHARYDAVGGQTFTATPITITIGTQRVATGAAGGSNTSLYSYATDEITVNVTGTYLITYIVVAVSDAGINYLRGWIENNAVEIPASGTVGIDSAFVSSASGSITIDLTAGDVIRLRAQRLAGTGTYTTVANTNGISITRLG